MKIAQFLCFSPVAEEQITAVHVLPEFRPCNRQRRWRRRLTGIIFPILIRPQENGCADNSSASRIGGQFCDRKPTFESETTSVRKSDSDEDRGSDEVVFSSSSSSSPKTPSSFSSSSSLSYSDFPTPRPRGGVEAGAERRYALCFLVVSLMVMVFCGRICAILWTASGLCFLPRRKPAPETPEFGGVETPALAASALPPAADRLQKRLYEYDKRRVVLEGFLGRSKRV
ncbi:hypothetical protein IEQ34_012125 [Dendrobium chrysotoxum]|uniref:Transmembrane protein n=1 Tax=Dendrobium chrysotoxum TaxID=161865 RepID=A0AAV7GRQ6_DENCH|nr:hypothetical protein IEQ34_012125 [Dendrobium chrysotoxum]